MIPTNITIPVEKVLDFARKSNGRFEIEGVQMRVSQTLRVFLLHGTTCCCCKKSALYFQIVQSGIMKKIILVVEPISGRKNINYMTKDHIVPKSLGGPNIMENFQVMCYHCNQQKSNELDIDTIPDNLKKYIKKDSNVNEPVKRTISTTKLKSSLPSLAMTSTQIPSNINPYKVFEYKAYIRWRSIIFHSKTDRRNWWSGVRKSVDRLRHQKPDFDIDAYNYAINELHEEIKNQPKFNEYGKPISQMHPATLFRKSNEC